VDSRFRLSVPGPSPHSGLQSPAGLVHPPGFGSSYRASAARAKSAELDHGPAEARLEAAAASAARERQSSPRTVLISLKPSVDRSRPRTARQVLARDKSAAAIPRRH
jgi:hypothetical protein